MRSKKGDVIARAAIKEIQNHGLDQLFERISLTFPRDPRVLVERFNIKLVPFDFSKPGAEILCFSNGDWYIGYRKKDCITSQNFAIVHGTIHWVIHRHKDGFDGCRMKWQFEVGANAAGALLMVPDNELEQFIYLYDFHNIRSLKDVVDREPFLRSIAKYFGVSVYVIGYRLIEHKLIRKEAKQVLDAYLNTLYSTSPGRPA